MIFFNELIIGFDGFMGLLIGFGHGFGAKLRWWIVVASMWWVVGCGGTVGRG